MNRIGRLVVVEDDAELAAGLRAALAAEASEIQVADRAAAAVELIRQFRPELVILDVVLREGTAFDVLEAARSLEPRPTIIAISGSVGPDASFRLAQLGVRVFLSKPFTGEALSQAVDRALGSVPDLAPLLRDSVGRRPVKEVEQEVRRIMVHEALARAGGSRRRAAGLLSISRQLLQHILRGEM